LRGSDFSINLERPPICKDLHKLHHQVGFLQSSNLLISLAYGLVSEKASDRIFRSSQYYEKYPILLFSEENYPLLVQKYHHLV